ncbi:uncharacterized protein EI90DRAFT_2867159, partial [Cantharellus anzutake]|uniref:uncharacterized protein n=1 Tax=Cantharellus anzutake TaxID=1750568 RepID=UPI001907C6A2
TRYSVLPAMSLDGILHCDIQVGTYMAKSFDHFIEALLATQAGNRCTLTATMNPFPQRNSVLVMDNVAIHKSDQLAQMCE